ncbi:hypothetical protein AZH53_02240 [Methanomicrobiaceae archaeon CYW5]|nr:hypothetical protein [Methanovulcanius yangii]
MILLAISGAGMAAQPSGVIQEAPLNPAFSEAVGNVPDFVLTNVHPGANGNGHGIPSGVIPSPIDRSYLKGKNIESIASVEPTADESGPATLESDTGDYYYDLRDHGLVTTVKNQGNLGTCWAFATYGSLESVLLPRESWDFSESNLANTHGFDWGPASGGNMDMSTAYLVRWSGPIAEADEPYYTSTYNENLPQQKNVQEVLFIPGRSGPLDNDNLKWAIENYGGVYSTIYWDQYDPADYSPQTYSFYNPDNSESNHAITLVGWDDSYSRTLFEKTPAGDGAFIAKNSWGPYWGDGGYFYISYYDPQIGTSNAVFTAEPLDTYTGIYQYDPLGQVSSFGYGTTTAWFANVFTAKAGEDLSAVGFYTNDVDCRYEVYVYTDPSNGPINSAGAVSTTSGTIGIPGYHTVDLTTPASLAAGQDFSVVVKMTTTDYTFPVAFEFPWSGYSGGATANAGESYYGPDGSHWYDLTGYRANANVCLKAYTVQAGGNYVPQAFDDQYATDENTALVISAPGILANDYDPNGDSLTAILVTDVIHGDLSMQTDGSFGYLPSTGFTGTDVFTYRAFDGELWSAATEVTIAVNEVNSAPTASPDGYTTKEDTVLHVVVPGVLGNDVDTDDDTLSAVLSTLPNHGTLVLNADGSFTYTPGADYYGADSFTYRAYDGRALSSAVTVSLGIAAVNDAPIAQDDVATTTPGVGISIDVLANDDDVDGDALTINSVGIPSHGTTALSGTAVIYTPVDATYSGEDSFTYTVSDNNGGLDSATVIITINKPAIAPVASFDCSATTILVRDTVRFTDTSTNEPDSWYWTFGDGLTSTEQNPVHQYKKPGTYSVSLTVSNDAGSSKKTMDITVLKFALTPTPTPEPTPENDITADFSADVTSGSLPLTIAFAGQSTGNPLSYKWDFGDGTPTSGEKDPVHTYISKGFYTVTLTVWGEDGSSDTVVKKRFIKALP